MVVTRTWDLSESLGRPLVLDPELAEFALGIARRVLPDERRDDEELPFDSAVPAPEGADAYGRLAAYLGRRPLSWAQTRRAVGTARPAGPRCPTPRRPPPGSRRRGCGW